MDLNDLYKLAGIPRNDTPAIEPQEVEQEVTETPFDGRSDMRAMIALISPEQLNQLTGDATVAEEVPGENVSTKPNPQEYKGTLGSPADLSLRRYLGANGMPVSMDEGSVYEDHKVEDISEAWNAYKAVNEAPLRMPRLSPGALGGPAKPKSGEPIPGPRPDAPQNPSGGPDAPYRDPPMPTPGGGPDAPPARAPGTPDMPELDIGIGQPDMPELDIGIGQPDMPELDIGIVAPGDMPAIDPKDLEGDMPSQPDMDDAPSEPELDFFGRNKDKLAKKDAEFKKYGLTPPRSESTVNEEPNESNAFIGAQQGKKKGDKFSVGGKTYTKEMDRVRALAGMEPVTEDEDEGMIIYVGDQKFEYADYTLSDAMNVVDEYADEMDGEEYKVYNADGELVASGKVGEPMAMEGTDDAGKVGHMEMFFTDRDGGEKSMEVEVTLKDGKLEVTGDMPGPEDDLYWDDADIESQLLDAMQDADMVIDWDDDESDEMSILKRNAGI